MFVGFDALIMYKAMGVCKRSTIEPPHDNRSGRGACPRCLTSRYIEVGWVCPENQTAGASPSSRPVIVRRLDADCSCVLAVVSLLED